MWLNDFVQEHEWLSMGMVSIVILAGVGYVMAQNPVRSINASGDQIVIVLKLKTGKIITIDCGAEECRMQEKK